jgi:hypothetical protein
VRSEVLSYGIAALDTQMRKYFGSIAGTDRPCCGLKRNALEVRDF